MRVLHLTRDFPPHHSGGLSTAVGGLVRACRAGGIDCAVLSFDGWRPLARERENAAAPAEPSISHGVPVWRVRTPDQVPAMVAAAAVQHPHLLHVHDGMVWQYGEMLRRSCCGAAVCVSAHVLHRRLNQLRGVEGPTMSLAGQEAALAGADAVIAPSRTAFDLLAEDYPWLLPRLHCIGLGCEPTASARRPGPVPLALYAGRFADVKGTAELLAVIPRLLDSVRELRIVIAGGNPESPKNERRWLRRLVTAVPPAALSRLLFTGWLSPAALATVSLHATLLLVPSWFESFGLAALEGMSCGLPVVGTTGGALPELVSNGVCGLLAPPRDADALLENALLLLADPDLARRMGAAAARRAGQRYRWPEVAARHAKLYRRLVGHC